MRRGLARQMLVLASLPILGAMGISCRRTASAARGTIPPASPSVATPTAILTATTAPATPPSPAPATRPTYHNESVGLTLTYPTDWTPRPSTDYQLLLVPTGAKTDDRSISLEIPSLPPHLPGMIPLRLVRNGYVDDLKQQFPNAAVTDLTPPTILGANTRLVHSTWTDATGAPRAETALIIVRGDHVYILRADDTTAGEPATRTIFDAVVRALKWGK